MKQILKIPKTILGFPRAPCGPAEPCGPVEPCPLLVFVRHAACRFDPLHVAAAADAAADAARFAAAAFPAKGQALPANSQKAPVTGPQGHREP